MIISSIYGNKVINMIMIYYWLLMEIWYTMMIINNNNNQYHGIDNDLWLIINGNMIMMIINYW